MQKLKIDEEEEEIKVILVGEIATGKTNLINTSMGLEFQDKTYSTQTSSISKKRVIVKNKKYCINLWDTIGQEQFRSLTKIFMKDSKIVIFVYDITRNSTFKQIKEFWYENAKNELGDDPVMAVVGNKEDLYYESEVSDDEVEKFTKENNLLFRLTSAKTPKSFNNFLEELVKIYIKKSKNIKNEENDENNKNILKLNKKNNKNNKNTKNTKKRRFC
jgi:small GTP-binding protein